MPSPSRDEFLALIAAERARTPSTRLVVPLASRLLSDQLTPVLAYRRLVAPDERTAPSFLLESVEGGERQGRYSILSSEPAVRILAKEHAVRFSDSRTGETWSRDVTDPLEVPRAFARERRLVPPPSPGPRPMLPACFLGGFVGYAGYDTVRYAEPAKLPFAFAPRDDRDLPDLQFCYYDHVVVFDHADKTVSIVALAEVAPGADPAAAYDAATRRIASLIERIETHSKPLPSGLLDAPAAAPTPLPSNLTRDDHSRMLARAKEYIKAGDIFQVVLGQRFVRESAADPFDVYRALRAVNPSPYMVYMQGEGCILVASSPEILCRVRATSPLPRGKGPGEGLSSSTLSSTNSHGTGVPPVSSPSTSPRFLVTNRPLAGTRRRGSTPAEDLALAHELLADPKERAEHIMLVDLGRNDVGQVSKPGTIDLPAIMEIERYSHVMHISSTVTGELRDGLDCWDALRAALPVGTISGAPKIRAMQIIDELEPLRRGPYGGGLGYVGLDGQMDIALALRTIVVPTALRQQGPASGRTGSTAKDRWTYHLQAAGGIVADSNPEDEYQETVNKAAALARAIDVAERAFGTPSR